MACSPRQVLTVEEPYYSKNLPPLDFREGFMKDENHMCSEHINVHLSEEDVVDGDYHVYPRYKDVHVLDSGDDAVNDEYRFCTDNKDVHLLDCGEDAVDDEYHVYPEHKDLPLLDAGEDAMSSSSDSDRSQPVSRMSFSGKSVRRKWIKPYNTDDLDPGLSDLFQTIIRTVPVKKGQLRIYPPCFHEEMKRNNKDIVNSMKKLNYEHCFAMSGVSLVSTLNITNNLISVPKGIRCDVCIISNNNPIFLLTFVENEINISKKERYNELLTRELTNILRTFMDEKVSIVSCVVAKGTDLKTKIKNLQTDANTSFFANNDAAKLSVEDGTLQSAITALLTATSRAPSYQFIENRPGVIWTLSPDEVEVLLEHIDDRDGHSYTSTLKDPGLLLEIASRASKRRRVRLDITQQQYSSINISELRRWYPHLEVTRNAVPKDGTIHGELVRVREDTLPDMDGNGSPRLSKRALKRRRKQAKNPPKPSLGNGGSTVPGSHGERKEVYGTEIKERRSLRTILHDFRLPYCLIVLGFLLLYRAAVASSSCYCVLKCLPVLFLVSVVGRDYLLQESTHKKALLLFGLMCSCVGDALFVWKSEYFELGLTFFSLAHISYGFGFGLKPIGLKKLLIQVLFTCPVFFHFTWKLQGITWFLLFLYSIALNIMIWRVIATLKCLWCYESVSVICFIIANINILVKMSETQYPFSHQISMTLYYTAQLGMVMSLLKRSREEGKGEDCKYRTKVFFGVLVLYMVCSGLPSLHAVLTRQYRVVSPVHSVSEVLLITCGCCSIFWLLISSKRRYCV